MISVASFLFGIRHLTVSEWYGLVVGSVMIGSWIWHWRWWAPRRRWVGGWRGRAFRRRLPRIVRFLSVSTVGEMVVLLAYLLVNGLCLVVGSDGASVGGRSGMIALWNFLLLSLGQPLCIPADLLGLSERTYRRCHRWVGRVCVVEVTLHAYVALRATSWHAVMSRDAASLVVCPCGPASSVRDH